MQTVGIESNKPKPMQCEGRTTRNIELIKIMIQTIKKHLRLYASLPWLRIYATHEWKCYAK